MLKGGVLERAESLLVLLVTSRSLAFSRVLGGVVVTVGLSAETKSTKGFVELSNDARCLLERGSLLLFVSLAHFFLRHLPEALSFRIVGYFAQNVDLAKERLYSFC